MSVLQIRDPITNEFVPIAALQGELYDGSVTEEKIADGAVSIDKLSGMFTDSLLITPDLLMPDDSSDYTKLQNAFNYAIENQCNIFLNRTYDITGHSISIQKGETGTLGKRFNTAIIGGGIKKTDSGLIFTAIANSSDFYFFGVKFESNKGAECYAFNENLIRNALIGCQFSGVDCVYTHTGTDAFIQSVRVSHCTITNNADYAFDLIGVYDAVFEDCLCEFGKGFINYSGSGYYSGTRGFTVSNCCMESLEDAILVNDVLFMRIIGCYFEYNKYYNIRVTGDVNDLRITNCGLWTASDRLSTSCENIIELDSAHVLKMGIDGCFAEYGRILQSSGVTGARINWWDNRERLTSTSDNLRFLQEKQVVDNIVDASSVHASITLTASRAVIAGDIVYVYLAFNCSSALSNGTLLFTIPDYKPMSLSYLVGGNTSPGNNAMVTLTADGQVKAYGSTIKAVNNIVITGCFVRV